MDGTEGQEVLVEFFFRKLVTFLLSSAFFLVVWMHDNTNAQRGGQGTVNVSTKTLISSTFPSARQVECQERWQQHLPAYAALFIPRDYFHVFRMHVAALLLLKIHLANEMV